MNEAEVLKALADIEKREAEEEALCEKGLKPRPLEAYSTTQLKAELRRRKKERHG